MFSSLTHRATSLGLAALLTLGLLASIDQLAAPQASQKLIAASATAASQAAPDATPRRPLRRS